MTEIGMRVARVLAKRNITRDNRSIEYVAEIIDEVAQFSLICEVLTNLNGLQIIEIATSERAKDSGTY